MIKYFGTEGVTSSTLSPNHTTNIKDNILVGQCPLPRHTKKTMLPYFETLCNVISKYFKLLNFKNNSHIFKPFSEIYLYQTILKIFSTYLSFILKVPFLEDFENYFLWNWKIKYYWSLFQIYFEMLLKYIFKGFESQILTHFKK